jgi:hypothetical protein
MTENTINNRPEHDTHGCQVHHIFLFLYLNDDVNISLQPSKRPGKSDDKTVSEDDENIDETLYGNDRPDNVTTKYSVTEHNGVQHYFYFRCRLAVTQHVPHVKQELLTLPEHMRSPLVLSGVRVVQSFYFLCSVL